MLKLHSTLFVRMRYTTLKTRVCFKVRLTLLLILFHGIATVRSFAGRTLMCTTNCMVMQKVADVFASCMGTRIMEVWTPK